MIGRADIEGSKSNVAMNAWLPQASYPCGNFSDTSSFKFRRSKGSIGHAFTVRIRTGNQKTGLNPAHVPYWWVNNPTLGEFCFTMIGRADIEGSKSNVAMNAWLPQASYPCGNFSDTSSFKFRRSKGSIGHAFMVRIRTGNHNQTSLRTMLLLGLPRAVGFGDPFSFNPYFSYPMLVAWGGSCGMRSSKVVPSRVILALDDASTGAPLGG
ncbi:hypothetical protein SLA2020_067720 [Shorea laevis]